MDFGSFVRFNSTITVCFMVPTFFFLILSWNQHATHLNLAQFAFIHLMPCFEQYINKAVHELKMMSQTVFCQERKEVDILRF